MDRTVNVLGQLLETFEEQEKDSEMKVEDVLLAPLLQTFRVIMCINFLTIRSLWINQFYQRYSSTSQLLVLFQPGSLLEFYLIMIENYAVDYVPCA